MSNPSRHQQRFPFRTIVHVKRSYRKLPPISSNDSANEQNVKSGELSISPSSLDLKITTPPLESTDLWSNVREQFGKKSSTDHGKQCTTNKVVRIFVSSTFTDFFYEREVLIKKVFPALREEMEQGGIQIVDCDLRWGVPKDATTEQTILACLEELDRCFEDNGQPFFIGLISNKYGWVPKRNELPKSIAERYDWIDGSSITLMEFIHGAFRTKNPNAMFLIRNSKDILKNIPQNHLDKFRDKDELSRQRVEELKVELPEIFPSQQIVSYDCFYDGLDTSTGRERVKIIGLEDFENKAKTFLSEAIRNWYPSNFTSENSTQLEKQLKTFLINKTQHYVERPNEYSTLSKYVDGDRKDLNLISGTRAKKETHASIMAVTGQSGDGKTIFLADFVLKNEEKLEYKSIIFYYFFDGLALLNSNDYLYNSLVQMLDKHLEKHGILSPKTGQRLKASDDDFIVEAISLLSVPIIIIVDGLDKGDLHQQRNYYSCFPFAHDSFWCDSKIYMIISCEKDSALHQTICAYDHYELELERFSIEQRHSYVEHFFHHYNKTLESEQTSLLINNKGGEHPLYLSCVCENLRQFGDYSLVTKRLKTYPQTTDELVDVLLNEAYAIVDNKHVADAFFKLLILSNIGLLESDIVNMLDRFVNQNNTNEDNRIPVNQMAWSVLRRCIKIFLDTTWIGIHQLITFRHASIEKKLREICFKNNIEEKSIHAFMADFYMNNSTVQSFSSQRVAYHFEAARMHKELVSYLRGPISRPIGRLDRQGYLRKLRCEKQLFGPDSAINQRAYVCFSCSMQFKLSPFTMAKSSCLICTNMIIGGSFPESNFLKSEARLCLKHGSPTYPALIQCIVCKRGQPKPNSQTSSIADPVPLFICFECSLQNKGVYRCCALEVE